MAYYNTNRVDIYVQITQDLSTVGNHNIFHQFMGVLYAGTAKLGSVQRVGSTTRHGSSFLNSAACRVQSKMDKTYQQKRKKTRR
jgi:hypothetical protein